MKKTNRVKSAIPSEPGLYYARLQGQDEIEPVRINRWAGKLVVWCIGDDGYRPRHHFDWFGPLSPVKEKK